MGLIHIQAKNAADFGLDTLPRFTEGMQDFKHGALITDKLKKTKDVKQLISFDERFHPIMSIDCAARFLRNSYNAMHVGKNGDGRINVLRSYS
ncbi:MAG: hypothetical protein WCG98_09770 [bacterium]